MKAIVKKAFHDKNTSEEYAPGDVIEITQQRYEEILSVGAFVEAEGPKKVKPKREAKKKEG